MKRCGYCGDKHSTLTREHIIPRSKGGCNHDHNILKVCFRCNQQRGNTKMHHFLRANGIDKLSKKLAIRTLEALDCHIDSRVNPAPLEERISYLTTQLNIMEGRINEPNIHTK
jgi:hypothetical protein